MARTSSNDMEFSMFPFLDALSGVIGILALIIAVMAILSIQNATRVEMQWTSQNGLSPIFIECNQQGLVVHPENQSISSDALRQNYNPWQRMINRVKRSRGSEYFVFLIRPDGIDSFQLARSILPKEIPFGRDIVSADKELKFKNTKESWK